MLAILSDLIFAAEKVQVEISNKLPTATNRETKPLKQCC